MQRVTFVQYIEQSLSKRAKRVLIWCTVSLILLALICMVVGFVAVPLAFKDSIYFQRLVIFSHAQLRSDREYFDKHEIYPGLRNMYVPVKDQKNKSVLELGVWQVLPSALINLSITDPHFDYNYSLVHSNVSVLIYFHGAGETRGTSTDKLNVLRMLYHIISFDYRSFGDSSKGDLYEDTVISDCVQIYEWLHRKTKAPIFLWGHSLGSALATRTAAELSKKGKIPAGLILEAPFTTMAEELPVHPYGKIFSWLPWFDKTIIIPLRNNGFIFDNTKHIKKVKCPIFIINAEDDPIVPARFGYELFKIANNSRTESDLTYYYSFPAAFGYNHNFIYEDPLLPYIINFFIITCVERLQVNVTLGTHQGPHPEVMERIPFTT